MTPALIFGLGGGLLVDLAIVLVLAGGGAAVGVLVTRHRRRRAAIPSGRVVLALAGPALSPAAIDAAARIGRTENAVVMPAVLVTTPYRLPPDCPLPAASSAALDLLEVVENRLLRAGVAVDARIVPGRTVRHALRRLAEQEPFDRLVVPAGGGGPNEGFAAADVAWILAHVEGEIVVLRPARGEPVPTPTVGRLAVDAARRRRPARVARGPRTDPVAADPHRG